MPAKKKAAKAPKKKGVRKRSVAPKRAAQPLAQALAEAAWTDADRALADALVECDAAETAAKPAERAAALAMLGQALARAARKRGLSRIGILGGREPFDRDGHEIVGAVAKKPRTVRIQARGVARGNDILRRPLVSPATSGRRKRGS
jgi:hypothetical protein